MVQTHATPLQKLRLVQQRPDDEQILIADIEHRFKPTDVEHRRLLWEARTLTAQLQCAQPRGVIQGRHALQQIRNEVVAELPVSVIARDTDAALRGCSN